MYRSLGDTCISIMYSVETSKITLKLNENVYKKYMRQMELHMGNVLFYVLFYTTEN